MTGPYEDTLARIKARIEAIDRWKASLVDPEIVPPHVPYKQAEDDHLDDDEIARLVNQIFEDKGEFEI